MSIGKRNVVAGLLAGLLIVGAIWVWSNRQFIQDTITVHQYEATEEVAAIVERASLSDHGTFMFYANKPEVSDAATFNQRCQRREAGAAILGCYTSDHIFIYRVTNPELDGIKEVTAAHEMLHGAWRRLSSRERERLSSQLEEVYERVKTPELEERMGYYERQQPGQHFNELHSIIGTEVAEVGEELERYYSRFFNDRQTVVGLHQGYEAIFTELNERATTLASELEQAAEEINRDVAQYNQDVDNLNQAITDHNQRLSSVDRTNWAAVAEYNARRSQLEAEQKTLQDFRSSIDSRKQLYDEKVKEYNALAIRSEVLSSSIDSLREQPE